MRETIIKEYAFDENCDIMIYIRTARWFARYSFLRSAIMSQTVLDVDFDG